MKNTFRNNELSTYKHGEDQHILKICGGPHLMKTNFRSLCRHDSPLHFIFSVDPKDGVFSIAKMKPERFLNAKEENPPLRSSQ